MPGEAFGDQISPETYESYKAVIRSRGYWISTASTLAGAGSIVFGREDTCHNLPEIDLRLVSTPAELVTISICRLKGFIVPCQQQDVEV